MNETENNNYQLDKPNIIEVDKLAKRLASEYNNKDFTKWYCLIINVLGIDRVETISSNCRDAKNPGRVFSAIASAEAKSKAGLERLDKLKAERARSHYKS